jgi:hypothetical protein
MTNSCIEWNIPSQVVLRKLAVHVEYNKSEPSNHTIYGNTLKWVKMW